MRAGKLDRRITILENRQTGVDSHNHPIFEWVDVVTIWAQARPNRGSERFAAGVEAATAEMTFHMHYRRDLTAQHRIRYDGRIYEIIAPPRELGRRVITEVDCVARKDS